MSAWHPLEKFDPSLLRMEVISYYFKETYKCVVNVDDEKLKFNIQDVKFLNEQDEEKNHAFYWEIEADCFSDELFRRIDNAITKRGWHLLDQENSKIQLGESALCNEKRMPQTMKLLGETILKVFKRVAENYLVR